MSLDITADSSAATTPPEERAAKRKAGRTERTWKLTLAYDGGCYAGWQVQPRLVTVQGILATAIARVTGEQVLPQGSGRTDSGVHALGQVASFRLRAAISAGSLQRALNHRLPASIRILAAEQAEDGFHARHSSRSKLYEYRIWRGELCPPWTAPYVYGCPWPLRLEAMQEAAGLVLGEHDFTSFAARQPDLAARTGTRARPQRDGSLEFDDPKELDGSLELADPKELDGSEVTSLASGPLLAPAFVPDAARARQPASTCIRRLLASSWEQRTPDLLCYQVRGTGFLHHMVRNLVGTFLDIGRGHIEPSAIPAILAARDRAAAGSTAPARGLFLHSVEY